MVTTPATKQSARERLLDAADELFYGEGVHVVGIDRVIARAGVAKASLYAIFGSKDELIRAYLGRRQERRQQLIADSLARHDAPRAKILAVFDVLAPLFATPEYRGCAFINASAESTAGGAIEQANDAYRDWLRALFRDLVTQAGATDPETLSRQLQLLYNGAAVSVRMDRDTSGAQAARAAAATLLDTAIASAGASAISD
jgi:AcrR family transcriptional regulator